jgi:hypothetical protein
MTSSCNGLEHDSSSERQQQQQQHSRRSEESKQFRTGHPSLSTWNPPLHHNFSPKQMQVLTCLCDTLVPSIQPPSLHLLDDETNHCSKSFKSSLGIRRNVQDVNDFYKLSASDAGIPAVVSKDFLSPSLSDHHLTYLSLSDHHLRSSLCVLAGAKSHIWYGGLDFCLFFDWKFWILLHMCLPSINGFPSVPGCS